MKQRTRYAILTNCGGMLDGADTLHDTLRYARLIRDTAGMSVAEWESGEYMPLMPLGALLRAADAEHAETDKDIRRIIHADIDARVARIHSFYRGA